MNAAERCAVVEPLLYDYLHSWLEASEAQMVFQHLGRCRRCSMELQRWRTFDQAVGDVYTGRAPEVPPELTHCIMQAVRRDAELEPAESPFAALPVRTLTVIITLAALVGIAGVYLVGPIESASTWLQLTTGSAATALSNWFVAHSPYWLLFPLWTLAGLLLCYAVLLVCTQYVTKGYHRAEVS